MNLRLATLNVWALPFGLAPGRTRRMTALGERLQRGEADVWSFQEVWTDDARSILAAAAQRAGLHVAHGGGGLLLASALPLEDVHFTRYACRGIATHVWRGDWAGGKGFLQARVETSAGPLRLVDTHLHAQYSPDGQDPYLAHRVGQAVELGLAVAGFREPTLVAGDLNLREGRPEYRVLLGLSGLRDEAAERGQRAPTDSEGERIDYVLTRGPHVEALRNFIALGEYSDHAGVWSEIALQPGPPPAVKTDPAAVELARRTLAAGRADAARRRTRERASAAGAGLLGFASLGGARATRRHLLFGGGATLALAAAGVWGVSAERWIADEETAFTRMSERLDAAALRAPRAEPSGAGGPR